MKNPANDDVLANGFGTYPISDLLANDAASATFIGFIGDGVSLSPDGQSLIVDAGVTEFRYVITTSPGGPISVATATVAQPDGKELVKNGSFEDPTSPRAVINGPFADFTAYASLPAWTNVNGTPLELVNSGYAGIDSLNGTHWLDSQDSPASIHISQVIEGLNAGQHAQMTFVVAPEDIVAANLATSPDEKLDLNFDGKTIKTLTLDDFKLNGVVDFNTMKTFDFNIVGGTDNTLDIASHGASTSVGFAIDSVSIQALGHS